MPWLLYVRYDAQGAPRTFHVICPNKVEAQETLRLAERVGPQPGAKLVEYASFYCSGTIRPMEVPSLHTFTQQDFHATLYEWQQQEGPPAR